MFRSTARMAAWLAAALWLGGLAPVSATSVEGSAVALEAAAQGRVPAVQPTAQGGKPSPSTSSRPPGQRPAPSGSPLMGDDRDGRPWLGWWNDPDIRRELGLTDQTVQGITRIIDERWRAGLKAKLEEFGRERTKLNRMLSDPATTENSFELQVIKVEKLGSELEIGRTMMLFRILRQLSPEQVRKLEDIARRRNDRDRQSGGRQGPR